MKETVAEADHRLARPRDRIEHGLKRERLFDSNKDSSVHGAENKTRRDKRKRSGRPKKVADENIATQSRKT